MANRIRKLWARLCPWAIPRHFHGDPTLGKYSACDGCGHLMLTGHVDNWRVAHVDRGVSWGALYVYAFLAGVFIPFPWGVCVLVGCFALLAAFNVVSFALGKRVLLGEGK